MPAPVFDDQEKERIRYHMGYMNAGTAASLQFGLARPIQTLFLLEDAMNFLLPVAADRVRHIMGIMDDIEEVMGGDAITRLAVDKLDEMGIRKTEQEELDAVYYKWACRLSDIFGVPLYAYATKFMKFMGSGAGTSAGMIPVNRA